jgi:SAM-dependent methyltransferase
MPTAGKSAAEISNTGTSETGQAPMGENGKHRWEEMLDSLVELLPARSRGVLVDGPADQAKVLASRLTEKLGVPGPGARVTLIPSEPADVTIFLRTAPGGRHFPVFNKDGKGRDGHDRREREERADIVIDLHDLHWPVIRRVATPLAARGSWYLTETRAFFACRAATWDAKFGDDLPAYCAAVAGAGIRHGGVAVDIWCGTGRALPPLRMAVGPSGAVIALDITPEMLAVARPAATLARASLVLGDARALPFADASVDAVFAAGLVNHLPDTAAGLRELARVTAPGGLLVLFHPSGRAALAARHGHALSPDEPLAEAPLRRSTAAAGWTVTAYDDAPNRFFALAERR